MGWQLVAFGSIGPGLHGGSGPAVCADACVVMVAGGEHHTAPSLMDKGSTPALTGRAGSIGSQSTRRPPMLIVIDVEMEEWN